MLDLSTKMEESRFKEWVFLCKDAIYDVLGYAETVIKIRRDQRNELVNILYHTTPLETRYRRYNTREPYYEFLMNDPYLPVHHIYNYCRQQNYPFLVEEIGDYGTLLEELLDFKEWVPKEEVDEDKIRVEEPQTSRSRKRRRDEKKKKNISHLYSDHLYTSPERAPKDLDMDY